MISFYVSLIISFATIIAPYMASTPHLFLVGWHLGNHIFNIIDDIYIGFTYIPPAESSREKRLNTDHFRDLTDKYTAINSNHIIPIGDFNARTKDYEDRIAESENQEFE